jgi:hypothetical protein
VTVRAPGKRTKQVSAYHLPRPGDFGARAHFSRGKTLLRFHARADRALPDATAHVRSHLGPSVIILYLVTCGKSCRSRSARPSPRNHCTVSTVTARDKQSGTTLSLPFMCTISKANACRCTTHLPTRPNP